MAHETTLQAARDSMKWWNIYYHTLLSIHFFLGISGVVIGALIAANFDTELFILSPQFLGILSTVIVGVVSFVQPGRMASVFFDAYWRMRVEILRYSNKEEGSEDLLEAIESGFLTVATIQPEALKKHEQIKEDQMGDDQLSDEEIERLVKFRQQIINEREDEAGSSEQKPEDK
ncbi:hypothetical protein [Roseovarius aestuarii]|uniref:Uncharacterized protein n=1 Tax=Roseovarius aestuarii TaxID=475083 RepID=A0A1X7BYC8_9RHOB|nr:hypothetical protein [Roseovarius aestuarii]SMC14667.1 hypothetical protein ROA7745_04536 [Roseovarius aestuarii]